MNSLVCSASSVFVDSGAFSLYTRYGKDKGFYSLKPGTEFRHYCDKYAAFMKAMRERVLLANVDVIYNPELTWETQQFFEKEHGLKPVPIVHFKTPMKYVDRYLEAGRYDLIGVGGFAWGGTGTTKWLDSFFIHICPKSNKFKPIIRAHGFALTSWHAICRWPWWSVDSTTWFTTASFGGIIVPRWSAARNDWAYDRPPYTIQISGRSTSKKDFGRHYQSLSKWEKEMIEKWIGEAGQTFQDVSGEGCEQGRGKDFSYIARSKVNLVYFKNLEESRPEWPHPLDTKIVCRHKDNYHKGFGL